MAADLDAHLLAVCDAVVRAVRGALGGEGDWAAKGERPGQYAIDLAADAAALAVLDDAGLGVLSEESGLRRPGAELVAVLDPVDGSTNAARGVPWYATSICVVDGQGPRVAVVANLASGVGYRAVRGGGATTSDGRRVVPSPCASLRRAVVGLSGYPRRHLGWSQFRCFGAAALDLCLVASGVLDGYAVTGTSTIGIWDYLGGLLVCREAGASVADTGDTPLLALDHGARHRVLAAGTQALLDELVAANEGAVAAPGAPFGPGPGGVGPART